MVEDIMTDTDGNVRIPLHLFKQLMSKISNTMNTSHELLLEIREHRNNYVANVQVDGAVFISLEKKAITVNDLTFDLLMDIDSMVAKRTMPKLRNTNLLVNKDSQ